MFKWLSPNDKLATYGVDDPEVEGVACHFTVPEKGGFKGWLGLAEEVSDISLACRQIGPIHFKGKLEQGDDMFRQRRSLFFKKMQIVRGCDAKRNVLVYMVYSDKLIEGFAEEFDLLGADHAVGGRRCRGSEMRRVHPVIRSRTGSLNYGFGRDRTAARPHGSGRTLGSRQPTSCTNFCGADSLPRPVAALLRHRATKAAGSCLQGFLDPRLGEPSIPAKRSHRLAGFAGRGCIANIDVAIAHDCYPLSEEVRHNAQRTRKVARDSTESAGRGFGSVRPAERGRGWSIEPLGQRTTASTGAACPCSVPIRVRDTCQLHCVVRLNSLNFSGDCFVRAGRRNNSPARRNHFPLLAQMSGNSRWLSGSPTKRRAAPATDNRRQSNADHQLHPRLRLRAGWSLDGWFVGQHLPGVGTFAYNGSPIATSASSAYGRGCQLSVEFAELESKESCR